jgi:thiamine-phosphate diphosphorylase / hydroxyethylthiazole kinase
MVSALNAPHVMAVDYTLYLVTDSTPAILGHRSLLEVVEEALQGGKGAPPPTRTASFLFADASIPGVTVVQYRDKATDAAYLVRTARELHALTKRYGVPLLVNDRVDVAYAVGADGVHVGQDDMGMLHRRRSLLSDG